MPTVEGITADHHKYVFSGLVDDEVVQRQSRTQLTKLQETSVVHYHKKNEACTDGEGTAKRHDFYGDMKVEYGTVPTSLATLVNKPS